MKISKVFFTVIRPYFLAILIIIFAAALRIWPLQLLGGRTVWVTFYPAVMVVALIGGIIPGLLASLLSCCIVLFLWPIFVSKPFINDFGDWLSLAIFMITCTGISIISEAMRRLQKRTKLAKEQAEQANKAKSIFLSNMSHELRTPLNAILGFSRIMANDPNATPSQKDYTGIIIRSGEHLINLINNVLDIAKIESGKIQLEEKPTNIKQLLVELQSILFVKANEKNLTFKLEIANDFIVAGNIDGAKLRQVLINLIGNAIKFTSTGGIIIRAYNKAEATDGKTMLSFEVEDTGVGILEADQHRIFQSYVQLPNQPEYEKGTGLGLAICKQNVELMGGTICVKSEVGKGSVFHFEIPVLAIHDAVLTAKISHRVIGVKPGQERKTILIVEDQLENRLLLIKTLEPIDFKIVCKYNGLEAVEYCEQNTPDLIFMDMRMPVMDGMEATRVLRSKDKTRNIKIVALTAHALDDERKEMIDAGCDDFIRKPFHENEIFEAIGKLLNVKFLYENNMPEKEITIGNLDEAVEQIPEKDRLALTNAAIMLNTNECKKIIENIKELTPLAVHSLLMLLENYEYQKLIDLMEIKK